MINEFLNFEKLRSCIATTQLAKGIFCSILIFIFFAGCTWLFYPGIHDYDLNHLCYNATVGSITFWFPPLLGVAINGLYKAAPPLTALFILSSAGTWLAWILFLVSRWNSRYVIGTLMLLVIALHPFSLISLIQPGRDALICTALLLAVSLQCVGVWLKSRKYAVVSVVLCFIALAIRPEVLVAVSPVMFVGILQVLKSSARSILSAVRSTILILPSLVFLFLILHSQLKSIVSPGLPPVSGSLYYTQLRDLFLIARNNGTELAIEGSPSSCALSALEVQSLLDLPHGRVDQEIKLARPTTCYSYNFDNAARVNKVWGPTLFKNPISYLRGRSGDLLRYLGSPRKLRAFRLFTSFQYDESILKKCIGTYHLYPIRNFYLSIVSFLEASGDSLFTDGLFVFSLHFLSIAILLLSRRIFPAELQCIVWAVTISGVLHLLTFTMISPVTSFRYLRWFHISSLVAPMLVLSELLTRGIKRT
jgi:hypothetical protein